MTHSSRPVPADRSEFLRLVEGSAHADTLRDETTLRKMLFATMKDSDDPLVREIGEGLASGRMSWTTVATTSAYADFIDRSLAAVRQFDVGGLVEDLEATKPEPVRPSGENKSRRDDDGEDLWQGLRRKRR
ncbi:SRPBCC family protein [Actinophytocola xanthii]|uniref:Uncharacterized protein n=1 Tax=Actinophytocola xanthii TaxID=1912961 RepID=A0A1Q8CLX8_9PSEU|nr:hypothetical protein [Actinophytocola xanthii]OLF15341.1 hypothetical protein BU204_22105 [Actinophytocola xanthii]